MRNLEKRSQEKNGVSIIFLSIGGEDAQAEQLSANIVGVDVIRRTPGESGDDFRRRVYATEVAGMPLGELSEADRQSAYQRIATARIGEPCVTVKIGGE